ncbi:nucleotidyltransferase family protein [Rhabdothermincola sp.]|uniref:nucleotidyltransferase family protein n=1 Tax=Rhabdothermincola sp. TaxID=2820405 RepID=UPI002FDFDD2B
MVAVVLAAGEGRRLRPLTHVQPKPLCPVGGVPLLDLALERVRRVAVACSVNVHHGRTALEEHLAVSHPDVHVSVEAKQALGTAGALGQLRDWIGGRATLVVNADTWAEADLAAFVAGWDGERVRLLVGGQPVFGPRMAVAAALMPWADVAALSPEPSGLYERCWAAAADAGRVEVVGHPGPVVDCGTPAGYLRANLLAADRSAGSIIAPTAQVSGSVERSVIGEEARVAGTVRDSVLWPGVEVASAELLERAVRATERVTVLVR